MRFRTKIIVDDANLPFVRSAAEALDLTIEEKGPCPNGVLVQVEYEYATTLYALGRMSRESQAAAEKGGQL